MKLKRQWTLHNHLSDGVTIECRYFKTKIAAEKFAKENGYGKYEIECNYVNSVNFY